MTHCDDNFAQSEEWESAKGLFNLDLMSTAVLKLLMRSEFELTAGEITKALGKRNLTCGKSQVHAILRKFEAIEWVRAIPVPGHSDRSKAYVVTVEAHDALRISQRWLDRLIDPEA